uniref:Retrotransposon Orf1 n=1 Tax=Tanacetum cinerariifolium TaxID=118510 RepID=A0A6L2KK83_TANCI|nr:retrotransposon Orf1 [Tanacetum cinerariifolium]
MSDLASHGYEVYNKIKLINKKHIVTGNFTYVIDFMIIDDISSIIDPRLSQVVLGIPFVEISNMTYDPPEGIVRFTNRTDEIAYKMPHKIEQYNSVSDLEREHTKLVYLRNEEDKRRRVEDGVFQNPSFRVLMCISGSAFRGGFFIAQAQDKDVPVVGAVLVTPMLTINNNGIGSARPDLKQAMKPTILGCIEDAFMLEDEEDLDSMTDSRIK